MSKKIIAIALAIVALATMFVGCQKEEFKVKVRGREYYPVTDKDGNTIIDEDNRLNIYIVDNEGITQENEKGEPQTGWIPLNGDVVAGDKIQGSVYDLVKLEGWQLDEMGFMHKDGTEENCLIKCVKYRELKDDATLDSVFEETTKTNEQIVQALKDNGYDVVMEKNDAAITVESIRAKHVLFKVTDKDGKVIHYAENYFFEKDDVVYSVEYVCKDGIGYDETFDFRAFLNTNFRIV